MRLVTFRGHGGAQLGALDESGEQVLEIGGPASMLELIDQGIAAAKPSGRRHALKDVELLPPLPNPRGNIIAIGRNYEKHAAETASEGRQPSPPTIFTKAITSLVEPFGDIAIDPAISDRIDWEVELGIVIGKSGANVSRSTARTHVFGYLALNDVTARDIQSEWGGQYFKGKSLDRTCPTGPWIVTADEIPDPQALRLQLRVNGETKQDSSTSDMIYSVDAIIEWASKGMTLLAGSIIASGTPDGVGFARTPPEFLHPGDLMETEVERIGVLKNRIVAAGQD